MRNIISSSVTRDPLAVIVGVGPKLGRSIARKFAGEGYRVALLARNLGRISQLAGDIRTENNAVTYAIEIDCSDPRSIADAFVAVNSLGPVEVFVYNAHPALPTVNPTSLGDIRIDTLQHSVAASTTGPILCMQQILPAMVERGRGTVLFSGCSASLGGMAGFTELCCAQSALRAIVQSLAKDYKPKGVHIVHVNIHGLFRLPAASGASTSTSSFAVVPSLSAEQEQPGPDIVLDPEVVAQAYWDLHRQDPTSWAPELELHF